MASLVLFVALGLSAGVVTTVAGLGGGLLLLLGLSYLWDPLSALAVTTPALLVGNLHRGWVLRAHVRWPVVRAFAIGAVPGAVLGALTAVSVPVVVVDALLVAVTGLSVVHALAKLELRPPTKALAPAGFVIGGLAGSAGGAGMLTGPLFLSAGLAGETYAGTIAASGVAMHLGRMAGYGAGGLLTPVLLGWAGLLALAIVAGNGLGRRLRRYVARLPDGLVEHVVLVVCVILAVSGFGH